MWDNYSAVCRPRRNVCVQIRSGLLMCSQAASYSCPKASLLIAGWFQALALLGGLSKNKATNPAPKPLSELGDDSITRLGSRTDLDGGDVNSSVWPASRGVQHPAAKSCSGVLTDNPASNVKAPPSGFDSTNTSSSQEQLWPIELLMIYNIAVCLFCPESDTLHQWGIAVITGMRWNSTVLLGAEFPWK